MMIVVTHLTRMRYPRICVAGLDREGHYVRPVVGRDEVLTLEAVKRGALQLGSQIDLGWHKFKEPAYSPEVEDCYFRLANAKRIRNLPAGEFWSLLSESARENIFEIFGHGYLRPHGRTMAVAANSGVASLGDLWVDRFDLTVELYEDGQKLRGVFNVEGVGRLSAAVTDLRFYSEADGKYVLDTDKVKQLRDKLPNSRVILSLGLSRAMARKEGEEPLHWLQINGVHIEEDPLWQ